MKNYDYKIFIPSGNPTALVLKMERDKEKRNICILKLVKMKFINRKKGFL